MAGSGSPKSLMIGFWRSSTSSMISRNCSSAGRRVWVMHVWRVAGLDAGRQLLDDVAGAGVRLDVREVERVALLAANSRIFFSMKAL